LESPIVGSTSAMAANISRVKGLNPINVEIFQCKNDLD